MLHNSHFERRIERRGLIHVTSSLALSDVACKPLIAYPLTRLIEAGVEEAAIISPPEMVPDLRETLGDGAQFGLTLDYLTQESGAGMAECPLIARQFLGGMPSLLMPANCVISAPRLADTITRAAPRLRGAAILTAAVGAGEVETSVTANALGRVMRLGKTGEAYTGVTLLDARAPDFASWLPAEDGYPMEDLLGLYLRGGALTTTGLGDGSIWFSIECDADVADAGRYIAGLERRRRGLFGSPERAALKLGRLGTKRLRLSAKAWAEAGWPTYAAALEASLETRGNATRAAQPRLRVVGG